MLRLGSFRGAPIFVHATLPIGLFVFCGFRVAPIAWAAFVFIVLCHELGHAVLVRLYGHRVTSIHLLGWGGECQWKPMRSGWERDRDVIAWGGVLAQAIVFGLALLAWRLTFQAPAPRLHEFLGVLLGPNLANMAFNLLPIPPLDGSRAWRIFARLGQTRVDGQPVPPEVDRLMKQLKRKLGGK